MPAAALAARAAPARAARSRSAARNTSTWRARSPTRVPRSRTSGAVYSSTQHPGEVQHSWRTRWAWRRTRCTVECRRMGGGFGGKETQAGAPGRVGGAGRAQAAPAGQAAAGPRRRHDDHRQAPPLRATTTTVRLRRRRAASRGLELMLAANCGFSADLSAPVADRAVFHADNAYFLADVEHRLATAARPTREPHRVPRLRRAAGHDRDRGILGDIARAARASTRWTCASATSTASTSATSRTTSMTVEDNILQPLMDAAGTQSRDYRGAARGDRGAGTRSSPVIKRGIAITPVKFGISFTATLLQPGRRAGACLHRRQRAGEPRRHRDGPGPAHQDGAGRGDELGCRRARALHRQRHQQGAEHLGHRGLSGTDLNGMARSSRRAQSRERLAAFAAESSTAATPAQMRFAHGAACASPSGDAASTSWSSAAYADRVQLSATASTARPKIHYDKATARAGRSTTSPTARRCSEVEIDGSPARAACCAWTSCTTWATR